MSGSAGLVRIMGACAAAALMASAFASPDIAAAEQVDSGATAVYVVMESPGEVEPASAMYGDVGEGADANHGWLSASDSLPQTGDDLLAPVVLITILAAVAMAVSAKGVTGNENKR